MLSFGILLLLMGTATLGMDQSRPTSRIPLSAWNGSSPEADLGNDSFPEPKLENSSSPRSDLDYIPLEVYFDFLKIAEFSNEAIRMIDFPWIVSLQNQDGSHLCSANILTSLHVFTTCRCLTLATGSVITPIIPRRPEDIFVIAGVSKLNLPLKVLMAKGQVRDVEKIHIHPRCSPLQKFDYAVAEMDHFFYFSPYIRPIPKLSYDRMEYLPSLCSSAGWKETLPGWNRPENYLDDMVVTKYIILQNKNDCPVAKEPQEGAQFICATLFPQRTVSFSSDGGFPLDPSSSNPGDHGSGLLCNERVIGILSHHSQDRMFSMFTSIGPAMPFFSPFFLEFINLSSKAPALHPALFLVLSSLAYHSLTSQAPV
uniref:Ovochymase-2 n=1 Tax=Lygus hesperus TaxID=30085 RepID=A0A0A9X966_LYGHE